MRPDLYLILNGVAFNLPQHPGYLPVITYRSAAATTSKLVQQHKVKNTQFDITKSCVDSMKQKIMAALHNDYVEV